jgi:hypothetical protein
VGGVTAEDYPHGLPEQYAEQITDGNIARDTQDQDIQTGRKDMRGSDKRQGIDSERNQHKWLFNTPKLEHPAKRLERLLTTNQEWKSSD